MVIIAFSDKTSKVIPRIVCHKFKHCAPIIPTGHDMVMYQFTRPGHVTPIKINMSGIRRLRQHGWQFIYVPHDTPPNFTTRGAISCVDLSKRALGLRAAWIWRPDGLYTYLRN
ncbi:hypothetical protein HDR61_00700 [bacterium]|nr:hypothetical protein [bacterium]